MASRKVLVAALGNWDRPLTKHSVAQAAIDSLGHKLADEIGRKSFIWNLNKDFPGWHASLIIPMGKEDLEINLFKPKVAMNINGGPIAKAYKQVVDDQYSKTPALLAIHDELELAVGKFKCSRGGKERGHRGLKDLTTRMKTDKYARFSIGIGRPTSRDRFLVAEHVLSPLAGDELKAIEYSQFRSGPALEALYQSVLNMVN